VVVVEGYLAMAATAMDTRCGRRQTGERDELADLDGGTSAGKRRRCGVG